MKMFVVKFFSGKSTLSCRLEKLQPVTEWIQAVCTLCKVSTASKVSTGSKVPAVSKDSTVYTFFTDIKVTPISKVYRVSAVCSL
jgi:hypothetical protein